MKAQSAYSLFIQALNVTNAALEANRDSVPLKPMLQACEAELAGRDFGVEVYRDDPETPCEFFTIRLQDNAFVLVSRGKRREDSEWRVSEDYLRDVASHPHIYIENPALLTFDWLKQRLEHQESLS